MYDYVDGKIDWMAYGLPVEGESGPRVGDALIGVPTCSPDEKVAAVASRLSSAGDDRAAVVTAERIVVGLIRLAERSEDSSGADLTAMECMELVPDTIRPHVPLSNLDERTAGRLVTTPAGVLLGAVDATRVSKLHEVEHDAMQLAEEMAERFGDREPSKEELREFLRRRLVAQGKNEEEAERVLAEMDRS